MYLRYNCPSCREERRIKLGEVTHKNTKKIKIKYVVQSLQNEFKANIQYIPHYL